MVIGAAGCRAIAAAKNVDEVKSIHDASIALRTYARQSKNRTLGADAIEIRMRAKPRAWRRRGEGCA